MDKLEQLYLSKKKFIILINLIKELNYYEGTISKYNFYIGVLKEYLISGNIKILSKIIIDNFSFR